MFNLAPSVSRRRGGKSAGILNFLMIAEDSRKLGAGSERPDRVGDLYGIHRARVDGIADVDEPLRERIGHVVAAAASRHQKGCPRRISQGIEARAGSWAGGR